MTQRVSLSVDALRVAGCLRHNHNGSSITLKRIVKLCEAPFEKRTPLDVADELVRAGYLVRSGKHWMRTEMEYTQEMYLQLRKLAKLHRMRLDNARVLNVVPDVTPEIAKWFSYPTHQVRTTGRVHYLEDDE